MSIKRKISNILYFVSLALIVILFTLDHIDNALTIKQDNVICIIIILFTLALLFLNISEIEWNSYATVLFMFLIYCMIRTYLVDSEVFFQWFFHNMVSICLVMLCITPFKKKHKDKTKILIYIQLFIVLVTAIVDIFSVKSLLIDHSTSGIISNQNYLGGFNGASIIILFNFAIRNKNKALMITTILFSIVIIYLMIKITCRSAILAICVYFGLLYVLNIKKTYYNNKLLFVIPLLIIAVMIMLFALFKETVTTFIFNRSGLTKENFLSVFLTGRDTIWFDVFPILIKNCLIFGYGIMTIEKECFKQMVFMYPNVKYATISYNHNFILDLIYYGGLIGVVLLLIAIILFIKETKKNGCISKSYRLLTVITIAAVLASMLFDNLIIWGLYYFNILLFSEIGILENTKGRE